MKNGSGLRIRVVRTMVAVMVAALVLSGCSSLDRMKKATEKMTESVARRVTKIGRIDFSSSGLKKVLAVGAVSNISPLAGKGLELSFQDTLVARLRETCPGAVILLPGQAEYPVPMLEMTRRPGGVDNAALAQAGRNSGVHAVLTGGLKDIRTHAEERGFWWFRDTHRFIQVVSAISVYDTETGAKLVDESILHEAEIEEMDYDSIRESLDSGMPVIQEGIAESAGELADKVCEALGDAPWSATVTEATGDRVVLPFGPDTGLAEGRLLDALAPPEVIEGIGGQRFLKPGATIGSVRVTSVSPGRAEAEIVSGEGIGVGSTVRAK